MKKFNQFLDKISLYVNVILEYIYNILMNVINIFRAEHKFVPVHSINLNDIKYDLIQFKLEEINYNNIKGIVIDSYNSGSHGYRYMRIYNNRGQLIMNLAWLVETVEHKGNLINLTYMILDHCNAYLNKTKPWWFWKGVFYMHITDKNIYDEI